MKSKYISAVVFTVLLAVSVIISIGARMLGEYAAKQTLENLQTDLNTSASEETTGSAASPESTAVSHGDEYNELLNLVRPEETAFGNNVGGNNANSGGIKYDVEGKPVTTVFDTETKKPESTEAESSAPAAPDVTDAPVITDPPAVTESESDSESQIDSESESTSDTAEETTGRFPFPWLPGLGTTAGASAANEPYDNSQGGFGEN